MDEARHISRLGAVRADRRGDLLICFVIVDKLTPYDLWLEIVEKKNVALAIVVGAMCIAIGMIVATAVHG